VTDLLEAAPAPRVAPGTYPIPPNRGRWRLTLHNRTYADTTPAAAMISELSEARNRKLVQAWNSSAVLTFDLDGWRPAARYISELCTEVVAWRGDDTAGHDVAVFRGPIVAAEDNIDEQSHVITLTCTDYLGLLMRRMFVGTTAGAYTGDQDDCASIIVITATSGASSSSGTTFTPGSYLPLASTTLETAVVPVNPDGTLRGAKTGVSRSVTYQGGSVCGTMLDDLSKLAGAGAAAGGNAFDYDVAPLTALAVTNPAGTCDALRIFFPRQGIARTSPALYYPGNVTALKRAVSSADYSNYWRTLGNNQTATQNAAQVYGEAWTAAAIGGQAGAVGLWETGDQSADVTDPTLLGAAAAGQLNIFSVLMPTYTLTLAPGFYYQGALNMGDTLPLYVQSGRLNVATSLRVVGIQYEPSDDGLEVVTLTVGRDPSTLVDILGDQAADIRALARR
jgi:hypothetical protein